MPDHAETRWEAKSAWRAGLLAMAVAVPATMWLGLRGNLAYSTTAYIVAAVPFLALALLVPSPRWAANALGVVVTSIVMAGEVRGWQQRDDLLGNIAIFFAVGIVYLVAVLVLLATIAVRANESLREWRSPQPPPGVR